MKILLAPLHYWYEDRGSEVGWAYDYANHLDSLNIKVNAIVANQIDQPPKTMSVASIYQSRFIMSNFSSLKFHSKCYLKARLLPKDYKPDLLHHFLPYSISNTFNLIALSRRFGRVPFIIGPVQSSFKLKKSSTLGSIAKLPFTFLAKQTMAKSSLIIAISNDAKQELIDIGVNKHKIQIIPPGINSSEYSQRKQNHKSLTLITVGSLIDRKAVDLVIKAASIIVKTYPDMKLLIVGSGPEQENLKIMIEKLDLSTNVTLVGQIDKELVKGYYAKSDYYVSMSKAETWGQVYMEAMASGLPAIASENSGSREIIGKFKKEFLIPQNDYKALASKVLEVHDSQDSANLSDDSRQYIYKNYDWANTVIPQYLEIYNRLIHETP